VSERRERERKGGKGREGVGEGERDRQTDRQRERERESERDRQRERERASERTSEQERETIKVKGSSKVFRGAHGWYTCVRQRDGGHTCVRERDAHAHTCICVHACAHVPVKILEDSSPLDMSTWVGVISVRARGGCGVGNLAGSSGMDWQRLCQRIQDPTVCVRAHQRTGLGACSCVGMCERAWACASVSVC
jgi:hypothetical protein